MPAISLAGVDSAGGGIIISSSGVQSTIGRRCHCRTTAIKLPPHWGLPPP